MPDSTIRITDTLYALPLAPQGDLNAPSTLFPSLLLDAQHGPTLVDTGTPGSETAIGAALSSLGLQLSDLRRVILTHLDIDHVGSAAAIVQASGAQVLAHAGDQPYIEGREKPDRAMPAPMQAQMPAEMRAMLERGPDPVQVDEVLHGGELLDIAGGVQVVATPGHSAGHISLYLPADRALVAADAFGVHAGGLRPPLIFKPADRPEVARSIARLAELDVQVLVAYHGGVLWGEASGQMRALAQELAQA